MRRKNLFSLVVITFILIILGACSNNSEPEEINSFSAVFDSERSLIRYYSPTVDSLTGEVSYNNFTFLRKNLKFSFGEAKPNSISLKDQANQSVLDTIAYYGFNLFHSKDSVLVAFNGFPVTNYSEKETILGSLKNENLKISENFEATSQLFSPFEILTENLPEKIDPLVDLDLSWTKCPEAEKYEIVFKAYCYV